MRAPPPSGDIFFSPGGWGRRGVERDILAWVPIHPGGQRFLPCLPANAALGGGGLVARPPALLAPLGSVSMRDLELAPGRAVGGSPHPSPLSACAFQTVNQSVASRLITHAKRAPIRSMRPACLSLPPSLILYFTRHNFNLPDTKRWAGFGYGRRRTGTVVWGSIIPVPGGKRVRLRPGSRHGRAAREYNWTAPHRAHRRAHV